MKNTNMDAFVQMVEHHIKKDALVRLADAVAPEAPLAEEIALCVLSNLLLRSIARSEHAAAPEAPRLAEISLRSRDRQTALIARAPTCRI